MKFNNVSGWVLSVSILLAAGSAQAESQVGIGLVSSETGSIRDLIPGRSYCFEPGRPMAMVMIVNRSFRERMYRGDFAQDATWTLGVNRNRVMWNQAAPADGETVVRPDGRTYRLRGTYFRAQRASERVASGTVLLTLPEAARGQVTLTAHMGQAEDLEAITFISNKTENVECDEEVAEIFYRPDPNVAPGAIFPMIGGASFSDFPGMPYQPGETPSNAPSARFCRMFPTEPACQRQPEESTPPVLGPSEGGVGIGLR